MWIRNFTLFFTVQDYSYVWKNKGMRLWHFWHYSLMKRTHSQLWAKMAVTGNAQVRLGEDWLLRDPHPETHTFTLACSFTTEYICSSSLLSWCSSFFLGRVKFWVDLGNLYTYLYPSFHFVLQSLIQLNWGQNCVSLSVSLSSDLSKIFFLQSASPLF